DGFTLAVEQAFSNCPQYIVPRRVRGVPDAPDVEHLGALDAAARATIAAADTFFVASGDRDRGLDLSHRGGPPGFVEVDGDILTVPDFAGNRYFNTLGNFVLHPRGGLLFADLVRGDRLVVRGTVEIAWTEPRAWRLHVRDAWRLSAAC